MTQVSYPFDGAPITEAQYSALFRELQQTGVAASADALDLKVSADAGGMRVFVQPGFAIVRGFAYTSDAVEMLAIATANTTERIDSVVLRLNPSTNSISLVVLTGTPGAGAPALTQTDTGVYEFLLGTVTVAGSVTAIGPSAVTDARQFTGNGVGCWTTATRPSSPRKGRLGLNTTINALEWWNGSAWRPILETIPWTSLTGVPTTFPPSGHTHDDVYWQKSGRATLTFSSESSKSITVSAPFPIDDPSLVHISLTKLTGSGPATALIPQVTAITTSDFTFGLYHANGTAISGTFTVMWHMIHRVF